MDLLPCSGERVRLRRFVPGDLAAFQAYRGDPVLGRYQGWLPMQDEAARAFLRDMAAAPFCAPGEWMQLAIAACDDETLVGDIGLHRMSSPSRTVEIGYTLVQSRQGLGLATEAVRLALGLLWAHTDLLQVEASTDARNLASSRVLGRLGFNVIRSETVQFRGEDCIEERFRLKRP